MDLITLALAKKYTNNKFAQAAGIKGFEIVESLPTEDIATNIIYLLKSVNGSERDSYTEYVYTKGKWEPLGTTDLSWDELQDKPFYEEVIMGDIMFQGEVYPYSSVDSSINHAYSTNFKYLVTIGNQNYLCNYNGNLVYDGETVAVMFYLAENEDGSGYMRYEFSSSFVTETTLVTIQEQQIDLYTIEEKYIPNEIARVDNISWTNLKDKPFYEEYVRNDTVLLNEMLTFSNSSASTSSSISFTNGYKYYIYINGKEFFCTYEEGEYSGSGGEWGGNLYAGGVQVASYYHRWTEYNDRHLYITSFYADLEGDYPVQVFGTTLVTHQLEEKYIPDTIARKTYVDAKFAEAAFVDWDEIQNRPFGEVSMEGEVLYNSWTSKDDILTVTVNSDFVHGQRYLVTIDNYTEILTYDSNSFSFSGGEKIQASVNPDYPRKISIVYSDLNPYGSYASVKIATEKIVIKVIDEKYLPTNLAKTEDLTWDKIENKPFSSDFIQGDQAAYCTNIPIWDTQAQTTYPGDNWFPNAQADIGQYYIIKTTVDGTNETTSIYQYIDKYTWQHISGDDIAFSSSMNESPGDYYGTCIVEFNVSVTGSYADCYVYKAEKGPEIINLSALPMDAIVQAVIAALPRAEDETI